MIDEPRVIVDEENDETLTAAHKRISRLVLQLDDAHFERKELREEMEKVRASERASEDRMCSHFAADLRFIEETFRRWMNDTQKNVPAARNAIRECLHAVLTLRESYEQKPDGEDGAL